jgi:hypothetical protein
MQHYEIRVKGQVDRSWSARFEGLTIAYTGQGETVLTGPVRDQAALHGLLDRLAGLGLELISVAPCVKLTGNGGNRNMKTEI